MTPSKREAPIPELESGQAQALRKSEERFRRLIEFAPTAMIMVGPTGMIEMVNIQAEQTFGYDRAELLGKAVEILIPERYKSGHPTLRTAFVANPESRPMGIGRDLYGLRKDGSEFAIEIGLNPIETDGGMMVLSTIIDISERRQKALEASYLAAIIDSSGDAIIGKNLDGVITSWNPAAERLFGYTPAEALGAHISLLIPPQRLHEEAVILEQIKRGERIRNFETVRRCKDGRELAVSLTVSPIRETGGKVVGASKIIRDITEHRQAAEKLRLSEERFRSIFGAVAEGIFIADAETGRFVDVNEPGATMYGYTPDEMINLDIESISSGVAPYTQEGAAEWIQRAATSGHAQQFDWHAKAKDGRLFWAEISIRFAEISGRRVVLAIVRDVTDRRMIEAQLRQALKLEAIGTLAGGVAHELNNLLQPIIMMTELVIADLPDGSRQTHQLTRVVDAGVKASEIVQRILAFGRADEVSHIILDIGLVVREAISFIRTITPSTITLRVDIADSVGTIRGDKTQLTQVLINLATNARDAIGASVGTLSVSLSKLGKDLPLPGSDVGVLKREEYAVLTVEDSGTGMDEETAARIFEPFFTTKAVGKGTGLGLSVTHGIITGHGGIVRVDSEQGHGTRFSIYLPLAKDDEISAATAKQGERGRTNDREAW
ncbi:MAG TPA: PAS domain S-box protein [Rhizomicrobium sp.]|nr:PAS domain S-box protein [Rhizomicrobium sp.]